jgi:hypothetical protein
MAQTKVNIIQPALGFTQIPDSHLLQRLNKVHDGMLNNPAYPTPPVDIAAFKTTIDAYTAAVAATLEGGKAAIVERDKRRVDVIILARQLGHYVEATCKGDMATFVSSGFAPAPAGPRPAAQPVAVPSIAAVDQGHSGQLVVNIKPVAKARSYEMRYAVVPAAGGAINWTTIVAATTKPPIPINNLTAGTTYTFQVRAFGKLGFSDWSALAERMCI